MVIIPKIKTNIISNWKSINKVKTISQSFELKICLQGKWLEKKVTGSAVT